MFANCSRGIERIHSPYSCACYIECDEGSIGVDLNLLGSYGSKNCKWYLTANFNLTWFVICEQVETHIRTVEFGVAVEIGCHAAILVLTWALEITEVIIRNFTDHFAM